MAGSCRSVEQCAYPITVVVMGGVFGQFGLLAAQFPVHAPSSGGQQNRMAGLNMLAAIANYWNTSHLGEAVRQRQHASLTVELPAHISPLGWAHILLTGEYR